MTSQITQPDARAWLTARAQSYSRDARKFRDAATAGPPILGGDYDAHWAAIYGAIAQELGKLGGEIDLARKFAAKWRADEHAEEPTDEALRAAFATCAKPPRQDIYPLIREQIANWTEV
jgi:hypothetical protein